MKKLLLLFFMVFVGGYMAHAQTPPFYNANITGANNSFPMNTTSSNKVQWIYGPGVFSSLGGGAGTPAYTGLIDTLWVKCTSTTANFTSGFEVSFAQSVGTQLTWTSGTYVTTGLTVARPAGALSFATQTNTSLGGGWVGIPMTTPFLYNPALSLVIEIKQSGYTSGTTVPQNSSNGSKRIWGGYAATAGSFGTGQANMGFTLASNLSCATPSSGSATFISQDSVTLAWTDNNSPAATMWEIEWGPAGFTPTGSAQILTSSNPHGIGGLTQNTSYDFHVRAYCGPGDSSYYHPILNVTTLATCPWPTNLSATGVTSSQATLDWTENGSATVWNLELGLAGFTPTGNATPGFGGVTTKPFVLPGLPDNTCFDFYVQSDCGPDSSVWTGPYTFCTTVAPLACPPGAATTIVYQEHFDNTFTGQTNLPNAAAPGWTANFISGNPTWALESNGTGSGSTGPNAGAPGGNNSGYAYLEVSCVSGGSDTMISPSIDLTTIVGAARVKWFNHMYGPNSGKLEVFVDNGSTLTPIYTDSGQTHTGSDVNLDPWDSVVISLNSFVGQTIQLVYVGTAANPGGCSGDRGIDEITVEGCVSCSAPSALTLNTATSTTATVGWTDNNSPAPPFWHLEVLPSGSPPTGVPTDTTATNPYMITGLTPFTSYDVYVRAACSASDSSGWAGPLTFVACAPLSGAYTVDPGAPASGTNFQTLNAVAVALQCGISGPVVFNMAPGNTFNEQVIFTEVMGASATNTITFNGNGDTVVSATGANTAVIRLDGADYFTFDNIVVTTPSTTAAFLMQLFCGTNPTEHNNILNSTFIMSTTVTSTSTGGVTMGGSTTSATSNPPNSPDSNLVDNCTFVGMGNAVVMYGGTTLPLATGNAVTNCTVMDIYSRGINFNNMTNFVCRGNTISNPTRTSFTTMYMIAAFGGASNDNNLIEKNYVGNLFGGAPTQTSTTYYIYASADGSTTATSNRIQNNIVEINNGNGARYGIYATTANNLQVYNNTVVMNNTAGGSGNERGIWQAGTAAVGQDIQNNLVTNTSNGFGAKYGIWLDAPAPICDYNNVFIGSTTGTNYFGENGGNQVDLLAWQSSTPSVGANSISVDPLMVLPPPNQFLPTNAGMNDIANPALGVVDDYSGATRSVTPDMGALEFVVSNTDIATTAILSPDTNLGCYGANDTVFVEIANYGATTHDFSTNPTTVTVQVTGTITSTLTATINTDTLPPLGTITVAMSPTVNMTANGTYAMQAYNTTVGDPVAFNDTTIVYNYNVNLLPGMLSASPDVICASGTTDLTLTGNAGGNIQWQSSPNGMAPWTNIGTGTNPYTTSVLTSTTFFRALLTCNSNIDSSNVDTVVVNNPAIATTISDTVCGADTVTLVAIPADTSHTTMWYDAPTGGLPLATGTDTFSSYITGTDTFYVSALAGGLGTPILITEVCQFTTSSYVNPGPPYPAGLDDPIELTNISPSPVDLSGWKIEVTGGAVGSYTIPAGNILAPGAAIVLDRGAGTTDIPGVYLNATILPSTSSSVANGYILSDALGNVMDVTATNSYNVVGTGSPVATAADWTGTTGSSGGTGGIRRTNVDDTNDGSDWTIATGANTTNYGQPNVAFTPGGGCEGLRVPIIAVSTPGPAIMASATDTLVCVNDSTMLLASGAGVGGSYVWNNGGMTGVNFVPPSSPITYTLTGTDSAGCSAVDSVTLTLATPFGDTAIASPDVHCLTGSSVVSATGGGFIQWQEASAATGPWTNVGTNSGTYNTGTITNTMYYRALSTCGANTDTSVVDTVIVENPQIASTMGDTICGPNTATLSASLVPGTGTTISWYDAATGGTKLDTGNIFSTPIINATTTYYAVASAGAGGTDTVIPAPHASIFSGNARGYHFTAPFDFTITGLEVATTAGAGNQNLAVMRTNGQAPWNVWNTPIVPYTLLYYGANQSPTGYISVNIPVLAGDKIAILGQRGTGNSYSSDNSIDIEGTPVPIQRFILQAQLQAGAPPTTGTSVMGFEASSSISRVNFTYSVGCEGSPRTPVTAVVNPSSGDLALTTTSNTASTPGTDSLNDMHADGAMLSYYNPTCELIATIDDTLGGNALGMVTSKVNVDATVNVVNGQPYARRWYEITPTNNGPANVTLYFTQADFDDYNAHPNVIASQWDSLPSTPTSSTAFVRITKLAGGGIGVGTASVITPTSVTWDAVNLRWQVEFPVDSFSQFFIHAGQNVNNPLAVKLTKFDVTKQGSVSFAAWVTAQEENNSHFNLQRSLDGNTFTTLGRVNTKAVNGNSTTELNYDFTDEAPQIGHNYYRLEQVDQNGNKSYSRVVDLVWGADGSVVAIYPNPATDVLNVDVSTDKASQMEVRLLDMSGRVVKSVMQKTQKGMNNVTLDLSDIASGVYGVQIYENNTLVHSSKVNKQSK